MGNLKSKLLNYNDDDDYYNDECLQSTTLVNDQLKISSSEECIKIDNLKLLEPPEPQINGNAFDPRSPNICRTPINDLPSKTRILTSFGQYVTRKIDVSLDDDADNDADTINNLKTLRNKLKDHPEKSCTNNLLLDPRSPSQNINRTPLRILNDIDSIININRSDGVFLMKNTMNKEKQEQTNSIKAYENKLLSKIITLDNKQKMIDPRSPSLHIERTPIALSVINGRNSSSMIEELTIENSSNNIFKEELNFEHAELSTLKSIHTDLKYDKQLRAKENQSSLSTIGAKPFSKGLQKTTRTPLRCVSNKPTL